jgi:TRAP-type C4-dicarboxylate transport system permease small subunit
MDNTSIGRAVFWLARTIAFLGGVVLSMVVVVVVVSVIGRALIPFGLGPIQGDFEMVQAGVLFAVFAFMPWCHLERGHAVVAIVTDRLPARFSAIAEFCWDLLMLVAASFIAARLWAGLLDKHGNGESTFILRVPLWIIYSGGLIGASVFVVAAAYCALRSGRNAAARIPTNSISGIGE